MEGDPAGGAQALRASLDEIQSRGARHLVGWVLGLLAEAEALAGRPARPCACSIEAQALVAQTGERMYEAELDRLRGVLLPSSGASDRALEIATRQGAEMLVRRIHT